MSYHPFRAAGTLTSSQINRVAKISQRDVVDTAPDQLCLLKRKVASMDALEVSSHAAWVIALAAVSSPYNRMFQGGNADRLRYRFLVYGYERAVIVAVTAMLP